MTEIIFITPMKKTQKLLRMYDTVIILFNADFDEFLISVIFGICCYLIFNIFTSHARVFNPIDIILCL